MDRNSPVSPTDPVRRLGLDQATRNALNSAQARTVGDVVQLIRDGGLREVRGIGEGRLKAIAAAVSMAGVYPAQSACESGADHEVSETCPVGCLDISRRAVSTLLRGGVPTIADALRWVERGELQSIHGVGDGIAEELRSSLGKAGLRPYGTSALQQDPAVWRSVVDAVREDLGLSGLRERALRDHVMAVLSADGGTEVTLGTVLDAEDRRRARGLAGGWWLAWRDRTLRPALSEAMRRHPGSGGIGPDGSWPLPGLGASEPVSMYCHPAPPTRPVTVADELTWWTTPWAGDLCYVEWACAATGAVPASRDGLVTATRRVLDWSWYYETRVAGYEGWDDSCWCDHLGVRDLMPWVVIALAPDPSAITVSPREYGNIAWNTAHQLTPRDHQWDRPPGVAEAIADALTETGWDPR